MSGPSSSIKLDKIKNLSDQVQDVLLERLAFSVSRGTVGQSGSDFTRVYTRRNADVRTIFLPRWSWIRDFVRRGVSRPWRGARSV